MEKLFLNIPELVEEKNLVSDTFEKDKWRAIHYKTKLGEGVMLAASQEALPKSVTLNINLKGWYRIFIGIIDLRSENYTYLKLSDDLCFTGIRHAKKGNPFEWAYEEYAEEIYFKSADLTNQKLILSKPNPRFDNTSDLLWVRCEKMTDEETESFLYSQKNKHKCVQMHIDEDLHAEDTFENDDDYLIKLFGMKNTNMDFCNLEYSFDYDRYDYTPEMTFLKHDSHWTEGDYKFDKIKQKIYKKYVEYAHKNDMKLFATNRMSVASFSFPYCRISWNKKITEHTELLCKNRDGSNSNACSYAYPEIQKYFIDNAKDMIAYGFDGITMIFHRGIHIGFEKPVIERFKKEYPDIDPVLLPITDERLHGIWCDIMTEFMRKVRKELGNNIKINVITDYGTETSRNLGLDVETWAKEGLIDCICQGDMETYEDLTDCMSETAPKLIDMDKYKARILDYPVIKRNFSTNLEKILEHISEYTALEEKYGVKVYHALPWANGVSLENYDAYVKELREHGAKRFLSWNSYTAMWNLPEWYTITHIGNERDDSIIKRRFIRMLELDNNDKSHFNNNWRG